MKNSIALFATLGLLAAAPTVTHAQTAATSGPFADVPADHWAFQSVDTLQKAGIVIGYPDGTYGGRRAMTRYEFAVALARVMPLLSAAASASYATKDDTNALSNDLANKFAANADAIAALKKLVDEFTPELQRLGQDVAGAKDNLNSLEARVAVVEEEQRRLKIQGALDIIARGDASTDKSDTGGYRHFLDRNGVQTGSESSNNPLEKSAVFYNFDLIMTGKVGDRATANIRANFGDYLPSLHDASAIGYGTNDMGYTGLDGQPGLLTAAGQTEPNLREAYIDVPLSNRSAPGQAVDIGRVPLQFTKYTLRQVDADVYTNLYETDSGNIPVDGGKIGFHAGPIDAIAFAGTNDSIPQAQPYAGSQSASIQTLLCGCPLNKIQSRPFGQILENQASGIAQSAGIHAATSLAHTLRLGGTLEEFGLDHVVLDPTTAAGYNKVTVYGLDLSGGLPTGNFVKRSVIGLDADVNNSIDGGLKTNAAYGYEYMQHDENLSVNLGSLVLKGGYQYVGPYYSAPGYWGKIGAWTNPTNVEGPVYSATFAATPSLAFNADFEQYQAAYGGAASPLQAGDRLNRYQIGAGYKLTSLYSADLGYEDVTYDLKNANNALFASGKPVESYVTLGLDRIISHNANFKILYEIGHYNDKGTGFDPVDGGGNVAVGQYSVKF